MAIKPILFNTEMVRTIMDGRKTCTRECLDGEAECCICCDKLGECCSPCEDMDSYEFAEDCPEYVEDEA